jgi:type IV pilus assembly protein PilY1
MSQNKTFSTLGRFAASALVAGYFACGALVSAAALNISDTPPFLTGGVDPNLIMAIDDSGSMDLEVLMQTNDGTAWWVQKGQLPGGTGGTCAASVGAFTGCRSDGNTNVPAAGVLNYNHFFSLTAAIWTPFNYLFPNGAADTNLTAPWAFTRRNGGTFGNAIPPIGDFAWARSVEFNGVYFDPQQEYKPWVSNGTYVFADSDPVKARPDPVYPTYAQQAGRFDLTKDIASTAGIATSGSPPVGLPNAGIDPTTACSTLLATPAYDTNYAFQIYEGMTLPEGTCFRASGRNWEEVLVGSGGCPVQTAGNNCKTSISPSGYNRTVTTINIRYFPATFFATAAGAPPASFGFIATNAIADGKAPDGTVMYRYEIKPANFDETTYPGSYNAAIQNFANWFTYYRKRHMALRAGLGKAFNTVTNMRVNGFRIHGEPANSLGVTAGNPPAGPTVNPVDFETNRDALYTKFYDTWMQTVSSGTPNRAAVTSIINNYKRANGPITNSCQRNFGMLFTDGFSAVANAPTDGTSVGAVDNTAGTPYADSASDTLADRVLNAYNGSDITAMRTGIPAPYNAANLVRVPKACVNGVPPVSEPWMDCNTNPHMNFYAVTLGTRGVLFDPDIPNIEEQRYPYDNPPAWRATQAPDRHPAAVDDIWHATVNGRGQLLNARKATELGDKLATVLNNVTDISGSAASAAVSSGTVSTSIKNRTFVVSFDPTDWSGTLTAKELLSDTSTGAEVEATVPMYPSLKRRIFTVNTNGDAVPFRWADLDGTRRTQLDAADSKGVERLQYLRGERTNEKPNGEKWRKRSAVVNSAGVEISAPLGDIVSSAPIYMGAPPFRYRDTMESKPYSAFANTHVARTPMVYVGANDGMLHAFSVPNKTDPEDATNLRGVADPTGPITEEFAFIPGAVFKNLHKQTDPAYQHVNYVDGTPSVIDAFFGGEWHTVLAGGLNKGGQGIYVLDVTDPMGLTEGNASSSFMWEFTDQDDPDLGYTYSRPAIVRLHNGDWGVVFGNGYGSDVADGTVGDGVATLFVLRLSDGTKLAEIKLPSSPGNLDTQMSGKTNGLSTPAVVDVDGDDIVDVAYVGDLYGNLWKIDLSNNNPASWKTAYGTVAAPEPLFVTQNTAGKRQSITSRPNVTRGPNGFGQMVLFGTGKYLETSDKTTTTRQSFYGIHDKGTTAVTKANLVAQTIENQLPAAAPTTRTTSANTIDYTNPANRGWYIDLFYVSANGEMQITDSVLRNGKIAFTTLIPDIDPCKFGGKSWFMLLDALTGSRLDGSPFDLNDDDKFDTDDYVNGLPVSGVFSDSIMSQPRFVTAPDGDIGIVTKTDNKTDRFLLNLGLNRVGRQSWRQLR